MYMYVLASVHINTDFLFLFSGTARVTARPTSKLFPLHCVRRSLHNVRAAGRVLRLAPAGRQSITMKAGSLKHSQ
jgi:hypothetical protein